MIYLVEGLDGSGKSSVIEYIKQKLDKVYVFNLDITDVKHPNFNYETFSITYLYSILDMYKKVLKDEGYTIILHRAHISERVYELLNRDNVISWFSKFEKDIFSYSTLIYLYTEVDFVKKNITARGDLEDLEKVSTEVRDKFSEVFFDSTLRKYCVINNSTIEDLYTKIDKIIEER